MIKVYEFQDRMMPGQWEGFGYRKVFINEQVKKAIKGGAEQVLVLGAGFDTLCLRLAPDYPGVDLHKIDHLQRPLAKLQS
jgi:O-methyltransferase involved in polyketide biosynthesis